LDIQSILLHNLQFERRLTRETIAAMVDGDIQFKPTEAQMSFGAQALHFISAQETLFDAFRGNGWVWDRSITLEAFPTLQAILTKYDEQTAMELDYYRSLDPDQFGRPVNTAWGGPEPLVQLAFAFLTHEAHHRGQMITYLRLKGMEPPKY
jgi:uncharacterized damage-inducible protein DinB